jgi:protein-S-isoprenylcysteine O-methyltransferase Ste14
LRKSECGKKANAGGFHYGVAFNFWIKLIDEEKLMRQQFPEQYRSYQQRVKGIIPFAL